MLAWKKYLSKDLSHYFKNLTPKSAYNRMHKAKTWIPKVYQAIPPYMEIQERDPHEYKLRSKEEVYSDLQKNPDLKLRVILKTYANAEQPYEDRNRKVRVELDMKDLNLTPTQKSRLIVLLGPRYKNSDVFAITSDMYPNWEENFEKIMQQTKELILEAKRAP